MSNRWANGLRRDVVRSVFQEWFGTDASATDVLVALFNANGEPMAWSELSRALNSHRPPRLNALQVRVCELRKAMEVEAVDTLRGVGYALTDVGLAECRLALSEMGEALKGASVRHAVNVVE